jgi:hypothetical protein
VQELVKLHGGEIGIESTAERGTCFTCLDAVEALEKTWQLSRRDTDASCRF